MNKSFLFCVNLPSNEYKRTKKKIINSLKTKMDEESISRELRSKDTDKTKNCLIEEIKQNYLIINNHKKFVWL